MSRKGLTLIEIIVSMVCIGIIVVIMYQILRTTTMYTSSGITNVKAQDETKQITENIRQIILTSTYVEILDEVPEERDNSYGYIYSKEGIIYYYDGDIDNAIDINEKMYNTVIFSSNGENKILEYQIVSERNDVRGTYSTSINLRNLDKFVVNNTSDGSGQCIKFKNERHIAVITNFVLRESYNNVQGITEDIEGKIVDKTITVNVPTDTDVTSLMPSIKFFGDYVYFSSNGELTDDEVKMKADSAEEESSNYTLSEVLNGGRDFTEKKYYYVVCDDLVVKYTVVVKISQPDSGLKIVQTDSEEIIWYNQDFIAELEAPQDGTYYWYVEGITDSIHTSTSNVLPIKTFIEYDKNNGDFKKYELHNANQYEDVMRWITVKFVPDSISDGNPRPVSGGGILAKPVFVYTEPYDFYSKVATDVWIQTIHTPTDLWLAGENTVEAYKDLYKKSTGKEYDYGATYVNKNDNLFYDDAPEFIKVLYSVDPVTLTFKPYILSMDSQATLSGSNGYAKTIFGVDLEYYKTNIDNNIINSLNTYNVKVGFEATDLDEINGAKIELKESKNLYRAAIGVFNAREKYKTYSNVQVDALKGFRTITGAKIRGVIEGKPYVGMKIMNYSDAAENNILNITSKPSKLLEQYISNGVLQSMSSSAKPNKFTLEIQTQRQNNSDNSIIYYGRLQNENATTGSNAVPVGYVTFKEDLNNGTTGYGESLGISQTYQDTVLVFGDNYNSMNGEDLVDNSSSVYGKYRTVTNGNFISVGTSGDGINATNITCASYITDMNIKSGFEALNVTNASVLGHTTITGMGNNIENATILELEFDKPIRSGYDYRLYENDTMTATNIDTGITSILQSSIGKKIDVATLEKTERRPSRTQTDGTRPNMVVDGINIKNSSGANYANVIKNNSTGVQYAYKTGDNKIIMLLDKPLTEGNFYDISFERGAVRAVVGGDVKIRPAAVEGKKIASSGALFDLQEDIYVNGGVFNNTSMEGFGHVEPNGYTADKYTLWGNAQHYKSKDIPTFRMTDNKYTKLGNNFSMNATSMKKVGFKPSGTNRFEAYGVFNENNGNGYVMAITDTQHWMEASLGNKSLVGILCIKNRSVTDSSGNKIGDSDSGWYDDYYIGGMDNRVYFEREENKFYTFKSEFTATTVTLQVFDNTGAAVQLINIKGNPIGTSHTITIPRTQIISDELNSVLMQSGVEYTYFAPDGNFVISE